MQKNLFTIAAVLLVLGVFSSVKAKRPAINGLIGGFLVLALVRLGLGLSWETGGLDARYYANSDWQGEPEKSWIYHRNDITRIDPRIHFGNLGYSPFQPAFPLYFFNNWFRAPLGESGHVFSVRWDGDLLVPGERPAEISLSVDGGDAWLTAGETRNPVAAGSRLDIELLPGVHRLAVEYRSLVPEKRRL